MTDFQRAESIYAAARREGQLIAPLIKNAELSFKAGYVGESNEWLKAAGRVAKKAGTFAQHLWAFWDGHTCHGGAFVLSQHHDWACPTCAYVAPR